MIDEKNINVNGIAHIALTVSNIIKSKLFYKKLMPFLGFTISHESDKSIYFLGCKTGILLQEVENKMPDSNFSQKNIGLHHFCFRAREAKDIYIVEKHLLQMKAEIVRGPCSGPWVPGYLYILFEDPDKIRIEVNHVPKKGVFENGVKFNPAGDY